MAQVFRKEDFGMADERKDLDKDFQHMADPNKNKEAWEQKAQDASGRDWTKPRRPTLKDGEV